MNKLYNFFNTEQNNLFWLKFFRISISIFIIIHFIAVLPDFNNLYSVNDGVLSYNVVDVYIPQYIINLPKIILYLNSFGIDSAITILGFKIIFVLLAFILMSGYYQNLAALLLLLMQIILSKSNIYFSYGADFFTSMSLFYLTLIPSNINSVGVSPLKKLFQVHVCIAYFFAGFDKLLGINWWNGESIWKAINLPFATSTYDITFLGNYPILLTSIGLGSALLELLYPFFVWNKKTSNFWIYSIILMHIGIAFILNLYFFSAIMIIWNLTFKFSLNNEKSYSLASA
ncbi:hypothetical protein [Chryseobacterium sp. G0201]|uniref:hypothetical protein n=1 Tax=Chryseobacterium sp. G0201 TaxID=2487065 RepID=UPI000F504919|nr:hypothetical protein [Chryseobacterium sp. G0201]AZA52674.1 hypothetical protein EG348_06455 [Chryseobacterium sp. G0201]